MKKSFIIFAIIICQVFFSCVTQSNNSVDYSKFQDLKSMIEEQETEYCLIDVRTKKEFDQIHLPTSINLPLSILEENLNSLDEDDLIIVYCQLGGRASQAYEILINAGYKNVYNFGSIYNWKDEIKN